MASSSGHVPREAGPFSPGAVARVASGSPPEDPETDQRFPRASRLTARRQFVAVYDRGRKVRRSAFLMFGAPNRLGYSRLGLTVTRKNGTAVRRNRIKRRFRDLFRRHREELPGSLDLVVNGHARVLDSTADQLERDFMSAVRELARKAGGES
jgi:ribonuclease P protein component